MKPKLIRKLVSVVANFSLLLNSFIPFLSAIPSAYAQEDLTSTIEYSQSTHNFHLEVNTNQELNYQIIYKTDDQTESVVAEKVSSDPTFSQDVLAGTCSEESCLYHHVVRGVFKVEVPSENWIYSELFEINSGAIQIVKEGISSEYNLTDEEDDFIENGRPIDVTPSPTPTTEISDSTSTPTLTPTITATATATPAILGDSDSNDSGEITTEVVPITQSRTDLLNPIIYTDKDDYSPTEIAIITGTGFEPNTEYFLHIISDNLDLTYKISSDENGDFIYSYQLDGTYRPDYQVDVQDSTGTVIASVTFTDSLITTWPSNWNSPNSCISDISGDENPSSIDLVGDSSNPAVGFYTDDNYFYFRERVNGNPGSAANPDQKAWVVLFQISTPQYQFLASLNGKDNKVQLWENTSPDNPGTVDFSPLMNDPAETLRWEGNSSEYARITSAGGGKYYVDWAIPVGELTSRGITTSTTKFFATSADANNYNKDHLKCYEAISDLSIIKTDNPDPVINGGILTYTLSVYNAGPDTASGVIVSDSLPTGYSITSITPSQGSCSDEVGPDIQCELGSMINGANASIIIVGNLIGSGVVTNNASVSLDTTVSIDTNQSNNSDSEDTTINQPAIGTIKIIKSTTTLSGDGTFDFAINGESSSNFSITTSSNTGSHGPVTVNTGTYSVIETVPTGWYLLSAYCSDGTTTYQPNSITVNSGKNIVCYFNNSKLGSINVTKVASPGDTGDEFNIILNKNGSLLDSQLIKNGETALFSLQDGNYSLNEVYPAGNDTKGWYFDHAICNGNNYTPGDTISLNPGENINCTFYNKKPGTLIVKKVISGGTKTYSDFSFKINGGSDNQFDSDGQNEYNLNSGTYSVVENTDPDYTTTYNNCSNINLAAGATQTCTITNTRKTGRLYIDKVIYAGPATQSSWSFVVKSLSGTILGTLIDDGVHNYIDLPTGQYTVTESNNIAGYTFSRVAGACSNKNDFTATATVGTGNNTCYFYNDRDYGNIRVNKQVDLNGDGDFDDLNEDSNSYANTLGFLWRINNTGSYYSMGMASPALPTSVSGVTYSINENSVSGYHYIGWTSGASCNSLTGTGYPVGVTVTKDSTTTITLCNARDTGSIRVNKYTDLNGDGDWNDTYETNSTYANSLGFRWQLDNGSDNLMGSTVNKVVIGNHNISEYIPNNYHFVSWYINGSGKSCSNPNGTTLPISINVSKDSTTTIVLCNARDTGSLIAHKFEDSNFNKTQDNTESNLNGWEMKLYSGSNCIGNVIATINTNTLGNADFGNLNTGDYSVKETLQDGWENSTNLCQNITVTKDTQSTLNFGNRQLGKIIIEKQTNPDGSNQEFEFNPSWSGPNFRLKDNKTYETTWLTPGTYYIDELVSSGWELSNISCDDSNSGTNPLDSSEAKIRLESGETVNCTFNNTKLGSITIKKETSPDNSSEIFDYYGTLGSHTFYDGDVDTYNNLRPGVYTVTEDSEMGWYLKDLICTNGSVSIKDRTATITVTPGSNTICTFYNAKYGEINGEKFNDKNGNNHDDGLSEPGLKDWKIFIDKNHNQLLDLGESFTLTDNQGNYSFKNLLPGDYDICEVQQSGWYSTTNNLCQRTTINNRGGDVDTINFANRQYNSITVTKFNDLSGVVGIMDDQDVGMSGWEINLSYLGSTTTLTTDDNGQVIFSNLISGAFDLGENLQTGWTQTGIYCDHDIENLITNNNYSLNLSSGQNLNCYIGNRAIEPEVSISKSNNVNGNLNPGGSVNYTITLTVLKNNVNNLKVTDLLSNGFVYQSGSYHITQNGNDITGSVGEPQYHSPGVWELGDVSIGDTLVLTYTADISDSQQPGTYADVAWAIGENTYNSGSVLALADEGYVATNFVGTKVPVVDSYQSSVDANIENEVEGEVLGASTEMPSTGAATIWLIISAALAVLGFGLIKSGKITKLMAKRTILTVLLTLLSFGFLIKPASAADSDLVVQLEEPQSPTNTKDINLNFVALDIKNGAVTVSCYKKYETESSFTQFSSETLTAGGNASHCSLSSVLSADGNYQFYVIAESVNGTDTSDTVSLEYNTSTPGNPSDYGKEKLNNCDYKIHFKTADDGGKTVRVEIYRADLTSFIADDGSKIADISIGSNQEYYFTNSVPDCSKEYYYVLRAFSASGNGSGLVGDSVTVTTTSTSTTTSSSTSPTIGAIPVTDQALNSEGENEEGQNDSGEEGEILGTQDVTPVSFFASHRILSEIIIGLAIVIIVYAFRQIRKNKKSKRRR